MGNKKTKAIFISILILSLIIRLFCGVFVHDEFGDNVYFIKYKPTWKWRFYSPRGMSDQGANQLTKQQKYEQQLFDEYVGKRVTR